MAYLSSSIDNLYGEVLVLVLDDLGEGVLNGGVIRIDKVAVDELNSQRALAYDVSACWIQSWHGCSQRTHGSAADDGHLSLLLLWGHCVRALSFQVRRSWLCVSSERWSDQ